MTDQEKIEILKNFAAKLISNQKDIPLEFTLSPEQYIKCLGLE